MMGPKKFSPKSKAAPSVPAPSPTADPSPEFNFRRPAFMDDSPLLKPLGQPTPSPRGLAQPSPRSPPRLGRPRSLSEALSETQSLSDARKAALLGEVPEDGEDDDEESLEDAVELVQASWAQVVSRVSGREAGVLLFRHIFSLAPAAVGLFSFRDNDGALGDRPLLPPEPEFYEKQGLRDHASKVVTYLAYFVSMLDQMDDKLLPALRDLGHRHKGYNVQPAHYGVVGEALIRTLRDAVGEGLFDDEVEAAWRKIYDVIVTTMLAGEEASPVSAAPLECPVHAQSPCPRSRSSSDSDVRASESSSCFPFGAFS